MGLGVTSLIPALTYLGGLSLLLRDGLWWLTIGPLRGKGTIRNKEAFTRTYFEKIEDADPQKFEQLIDAWVLEYAEMYASQR